MIIIIKKIEEDKSHGAFFTAQSYIFLGGLKIIIFQVLNHTRLQKVKYLLNESLNLYKI